MGMERFLTIEKKSDRGKEWSQAMLLCIYLSSPSTLPTLSPCNPVRKPCSSHNLHKSPQVVLSHYSSFHLLLHNPTCLLPLTLFPLPS